MTPLASQKEFCPSFFAGLVGLCACSLRSKSQHVQWHWSVHVVHRAQHDDGCQPATNSDACWHCKIFGAVEPRIAYWRESVQVPWSSQLCFNMTSIPQFYVMCLLLHLPPYPSEINIGYEILRADSNQIFCCIVTKSLRSSREHGRSILISIRSIIMAVLTPNESTEACGMVF